MEQEQPVNAIETTYKGYKFRSRLEAKWACVFDQLGWQWEYEPLDLNGYIPDFTLMWPHGITLVEIKPDLHIGLLANHLQKIRDSGWDGQAMVLGAAVGREWQHPTIGIITDYEYADDAYEQVIGVDFENWDEALLHKCSGCNKPSVHHLNGVWRCRVCGAYDGDHYLMSFDDFDRFWAQAHNETKWLRSR